MFRGCNCIFKLDTRHSKCWLFSGTSLFPQRLSLLRHQNSFNSTLSKCTNKALGGCCNYFSGFCPGNAANFPCGSPKTGGKPELSRAISSIPSSTQAFVHFIYIRISKGTNVPRLNIDYKPPSYSYNYPTHTHTFPSSIFHHTGTYYSLYMLNTILPKLQGMMESIYINICSTSLIDFECESVLTSSLISHNICSGSKNTHVHQRQETSASLAMPVQ